MSVRRREGSALKILQDGRFKTQFEVGTSGGVFAPSYRAECELSGLGAPMLLDPKLRPVYGYISGLDPYMAGSYGQIEFVLKESVKARATFTLGDSLADFQNGHSVGTPVNRPGIGSMDGNVGVALAKSWDSLSYVEVQIHGGLRLVDVDHIVMHGYPNEAIREAARQAGIEVRSE